ncbi:MAG TPA: hypothetical protein VMU60_05295 [Syntrophobacteria bacterium]|nr:hypothetical protein [Syntrophobacteria bacterium]
MKRFLLVLIGVAAVVALMTLPASAADFKFGGMFWTKYYSTSNTTDGFNNHDDNLNAFYTRMRLYFTATASENLMAVFKYEIDDVWGTGRIGSTSVDGGSLARSDNSTQPSANSGGEVKNAYIQFNMPNTPLTFMVGALPAKLGTGLAFNDDTNGIVAIAKFDMVKLVGVYSRLNSNSQPAVTTPVTTNSLLGNITSAFEATNTPANVFSASSNWDLWAASARFNPTKELSFDLSPTWVRTTFKDDAPLFTGSNNFNLYNIVLDADYTTDLFSLYFTGGKNFGKIESAAGNVDFKGFQLEGGATVNVKPVVIGVDGYFSSGQKWNTLGDVKSYVTPGIDGRNTYNIDEIVFPGWFDDYSATITGTFTGINGAPAYNQTNLTSTGLTRTNQGYVPTNIWAIGAHADFKPLEKTLVQAGGAYLQFVDDVPSKTTTGLLPAGATVAAQKAQVLQQDKPIGTSLYLRLSQQIVDGLELKAAFGYLIAGKAFTPQENDDNAYKFATGLFWSW